mmetsp:Transcript_52192/g.108670  ORF Transcript_52192/g.108670 Transcript_52192/m.108670 type:complete len:213 (+) Transcript_52192:1-639(+)
MIAVPGSCLPPRQRMSDACAEFAGLLRWNVHICPLLAVRDTSSTACALSCGWILCDTSLNKRPAASGPSGLPSQVAKCYELPVASQARACQRRSSSSNSAPVWEVCANSCSVTRLGPLRASPSHLTHAGVTIVSFSPKQICTACSEDKAGLSPISLYEARSTGKSNASPEPLSLVATRKRAAILTASLSKITASSFSSPARASEVDGKDLVT